MKQAAQTSVKVATITGAAKDDTFNGVVYEDGGSYTLDVLANDPGAARLYSVDQGAGALAGTAQFPVVTSATLASGATVSIADGKLVYDAGGAFQSLGAGVVGYDTFVYTVRMANGALSTATTTVAVTGVNDPASISGAATGSVAEDGVLTSGGTLAVSDVDLGEALFAAVDASALAGTYGDFTFDGGAWTYTLRNGDANVQALVFGQQVSDTLTVGSVDGTASQAITVTINGADEVVIQQDPAPPQDPAYQFSLNRNNVTGGESAIAFVGGVAVLDYFTSNDSVIWRNQDFTSITEVNAGGNTTISYQWQTGNNSGTVTLLLVGVSDVVISGNTLTMAA